MNLDSYIQKNNADQGGQYTDELLNAHFFPKKYAICRSQQQHREHIDYRIQDHTADAAQRRDQKNIVKTQCSAHDPYAAGRQRAELERLVPALCDSRQLLYSFRILDFSINHTKSIQFL